MNPPDKPLEKKYTFWVTLSDNPITKADYIDAIKFIGTVGTIGEFWNLYAYLKKPDDVPTNTEYHVFQEGIRPMWEDEANKKGARWILRLRKGSTSVFWEELLLCMIGEQFDVTNEICGIAVSVRGNEDIISIWVRSGNDTSVRDSVKDTLKRIWNLNDSVSIEYKQHPTNTRPQPRNRLNS